MPENLECVRSVQTGSLLNLLGQGQKELAQEKDVGRPPGEPGAESHWIVGVDESKLAPQDERWDERDDSGQHHRAKHEEEQEIATREPKAGEAIGHKAARKDLCCHRQDSD